MKSLLLTTSTYSFAVACLVTFLLTSCGGGGGGGGGAAPAPVPAPIEEEPGTQQPDPEEFSANQECEKKSFFTDKDKDGFGDSSTEVKLCPTEAAGLAEKGGDTNDDSELHYPGAPCGDLPHGDSTTRTAFEAPTAEGGPGCQSEQQTAQCSNGVLGAYTGSFTHQSCNGIPFEPSVVTLTKDTDVATSGTILTCDASGGSDNESALVSYAAEVLKDGEPVGDGASYTILEADHFSIFTCRARTVDELGAESTNRQSDNSFEAQHNLCVDNNQTAYNWSSLQGHRAGSKNSPLLICNANQFLDFASKCGSQISGATTISTTCSTNIELGKDIDFSGQSMNYTHIIGATSSSKFNGDLKGNGRTLSNFAISGGSSTYGPVSLFSYISGSKISDFTIEATLSNNNTGGVIYPFLYSCENGSEITNVKATVTVNAREMRSPFHVIKDCNVENVELDLNINSSNPAFSSRISSLVAVTLGDTSGLTLGTVKNVLVTADMTSTGANQAGICPLPRIVGPGSLVENVAVRGSITTHAAASVGCDDDTKILGSVVNSGYSKESLTITGTSSIVEFEARETDQDLFDDVISQLDEDFWTLDEDELFATLK